MKQPDLAKFKQLVVDSQRSKVKDPKKLSIINFVDSWVEKLESGWLCRLVSSGLISCKNLTGYEIKIVGHLAVIISTSGEPKWASKLSYAFNCDVKTIRFAVQRHLEDLLEPSAAAITNGPHSTPLLMQTPTSHLQEKKRSFWNSVCLVFLLAVLNNVEILSCDIQNAYPTIQTKEKPWSRVDTAFGSNAGRPTKIVRVLYGLEASGACFQFHLASSLWMMGFISSKADSDVYGYEHPLNWMTPTTMNMFSATLTMS
jgi:hypothetical protein